MLLQKQRQQRRRRNRQLRRSGRTIMSAPIRQYSAARQSVHAKRMILQKQLTLHLAMAMRVHLIQACLLHRLVNCVCQWRLQIPHVIWNMTLLRFLKKMDSKTMLLVTLLAATQADDSDVQGQAYWIQCSKCDEWRQAPRGTYLSLTIRTPNSFVVARMRHVA